MPSPLVEMLAAAVGHDHVSTGVDLSPYVIDGRTPEAVVAPGSVEEIRRVLGIAAERDTAVVPWGGGTGAAVGLPAQSPAIVLALSRLNRIVEHEPGDLTVTAEAGVTIAQLAAALRTKRQWLSLDPPDAARATLGGVVAANASGPRRHLYGTARDLLIGLTVVTGDGEIVRGGGKVVKNVAGYDVPKLFVGSYGTLGVIVDVTFKLRPVPDDERFIAATLASLKEAGAAVRTVLGSDLVPVAVDLLDAEAGRSLGGDHAPATLVVGFDGLREQIDWQSTELARLLRAHGAGPPSVLDPAIVPRLGIAARDAFAAPASVMRFSVLPMQAADTMEQGSAAARARGLASAWSAHAGAGILTGVLAAPAAPSGTDAIAAVLTEWREVARANGGFATLVWAPLPVKTAVPVWDDLGASGRIMQRLKAQLDPRNVLNPGRLFAGI
jgi:glycolate oxidase FAD binding subunit